MGWIHRSSPTTPRSQTGISRWPHNQQKKGADAPLCDYISGFHVNLIWLASEEDCIDDGVTGSDF